MTIVATSLSGNAFAVWLLEMRERGLSKRDADSARALGVAPNTLVTWKEGGIDRRTALACAALLNGVEPFKPKRVLSEEEMWPRGHKTAEEKAADKAAKIRAAKRAAKRKATMQEAA